MNTRQMVVALVAILALLAFLMTWIIVGYTHPLPVSKP